MQPIPTQIFIEKYNGVDIYFNSIENIFYCNLLSSTETPERTLTNSNLEKIRKALDNIELVDGETYYMINPYNVEPVLELTVVKQLGNLLIFDDGTTSKDSNRKDLYHSDITKINSFKKYSILSKKLKEVLKTIKELSDTCFKTRQEMSYHLKALDKYKK